MTDWAADSRCVVKSDGLRARIKIWGMKPEDAIISTKRNAGGGKKKILT